MGPKVVPRGTWQINRTIIPSNEELKYFNHQILTK